MKYIAIIGAGSAGLFAAKKLSENQDFRITVFEKANKVATKLRASGGGKANILNADIQPRHYNNAEFMQRFLQKVNYEQIRDEFAQMGLKMSVDEEGRVYPSSFFSQTVVDVLLNNLGENVTIRCGFNVENVTKAEKKWQINDEKELFDEVIFASGTPAGIIPKNRRNFCSYLSDFQLKRTEFTPSLSGFKIKSYPKSLFGCKAKGQATLLRNGEPIFRENGEVVFKEDGISGIVILNLSAYYNRLDDKRNCEISLNFLPDDDEYDVKNHLLKFHDVAGLVHPKLNRLFLQNRFNLRNFRLTIDDFYELEFAQVCHGGIEVTEITENFELKRFPHLYVVGEMLNIDGVCGGYNLFFAFASACCAANFINYGN